MSAILEILKYCIPALIVFATVWVLLREYTRKEYSLQLAEIRRKTSERTLPLRLQACERMAIFSDRIALNKLIMRIRTESMGYTELQAALLVAIEHEFEHNVAQQIYLSAELWQILEMAKNEAIGILIKVGKDMPQGSTGWDYSKALFSFMDENPQAAQRQSQLAIRKEVQMLLQ